MSVLLFEGGRVMKIVVAPGDVYRWTDTPDDEGGDIFRFVRPYTEEDGLERLWIIEYPSGKTQIIMHDNSGVDQDTWIIERIEPWEWEYACLVN